MKSIYVLSTFLFMVTNGCSEQRFVGGQPQDVEQSAKEAASSKSHEVTDSIQSASDIEKSSVESQKFSGQSSGGGDSAGSGDGESTSGDGGSTSGDGGSSDGSDDDSSTGGDDGGSGDDKKEPVVVTSKTCPSKPALPAYCRASELYYFVTNHEDQSAAFNRCQDECNVKCSVNACGLE